MSQRNKSVNAKMRNGHLALPFLKAVIQSDSCNIYITVDKRAGITISCSLPHNYPKGVLIVILGRILGTRAESIHFDSGKDRTKKITPATDPMILVRP